MELRTLRPNDPNDMAQLLELMKRDEFGAYYNWFYNAQPNYAEGSSSGMYMLIDEGECVAHLGTVRTNILIDRARYDFVYYCDLLVSTKYRGRGYAPKILTGVRDRHDFIGILGMNDAALKVYRKQGFRDIGHLVPSFRVLSPRGFLRDVVSHGQFGAAKPYLEHRLAGPIDRVAKLGVGAAIRGAEIASRILAKGVTVDSQRPTVEEVDAFFAEAGSGYRVIAPRTGAHLEWRFWRCPVVKYAEFYARRDGKLVGWAFAKRFRTPEGVVAGVISETFTARFDSEALTALVAKASDAVQRAGCDFVKLAFSDPWAKSVVLRLGFVDPSMFGARFNSVGPRYFITGRLADENPTLHDMRNWYLTRADSEQDFTEMPKGFERLPPLHD